MNLARSPEVVDAMQQILREGNIPVLSFVIPHGRDDLNAAQGYLDDVPGVTAASEGGKNSYSLSYRMDTGIGTLEARREELIEAIGELINETGDAVVEAVARDER